MTPGTEEPRARASRPDDAPSPGPAQIAALPAQIAALPPRTRLFHVGLPKSGTTSLQRGAEQHRGELLDCGVRYPGRGLNHRNAVNALAGRHRDRSHWQRLLDEVEAEHDRRILLSSEYAALCTDEQAARFRAALGEHLHVLVTVRSYAALLPSNWQQHIKVGGHTPFEEWLRVVLASPPAEGLGARYALRLDVAGIAARWARLVGPERVLVIVADSAQPTLLPDAVADLLEVPRSLLRPAASLGAGVNRSLSWPEVEMIRKLNGVVRAPGRAAPARHSRLVFKGAVSGLLHARTPAADEPPIMLPAWAAEFSRARARSQADALAAGGYRVIGELSALEQPARAGCNVPIDTVPVDVAVQALAGVVSARIGQRTVFEPPKARAAGRAARPKLDRAARFVVARVPLPARLDRLVRRARLI